LPSNEDNLCAQYQANRLRGFARGGNVVAGDNEHINQIMA